MMFKKVLAIVLVSISILTSGYIRYLQTRDGNFSFTYDQARDMLDLRIMASFKDIQIIGPTTSINGLMLGPGYYYFNLPAFWLSGGNPQTLINWNIAWFLLAGVAIFVFFFKRNLWLGTSLCMAYVFAPQLFNSTRQFWNAYAMHYFVVFYCLALWWCAEKKSKYTALLLGITASISMHFEAAFGVVLVLFSTGYVVFSKKKEIIKWFALGALPWFVPQILYEVAKGFPMTKLLFSASEILGNKLNFLQTIASHTQTYLKYLDGQFILPLGWGMYVFVLGLVLGFFSVYRKQVLVYFGLLVFSFMFYTLGYHHELKQWYADSIRVVYLFVVITGIIGVLKKYSFIGMVPLLIFVFMAYRDQMNLVKFGNFGKDDPKQFVNITKTIDWAYRNNGNKGFLDYNYLPEIYDYPYVYAYWWYGTKKYGFMPAEVAYGPNQPAYVRMNEKFMTKTKGGGGSRIILTFEKKADYKQWLNQFKDYCTIHQQDFDWNVGMEIRQKCNQP